LIVAGGGVIYSGATGELGALAERTGVPVAETQAGKGALAWDHRCSVGAVGATGTTAANALAREADVVIGIGTRYSDFTTASHSLFAHPSVRFVNINVARADAVKLGGLSVVADAREAIRALDEALAGYTVPQSYREHARALMADWNTRVERACAPKDGDGGLLTQAEVIGAVNEVSGPRDVVVCAAGSMPGDLHKLWRARDPKGYHVEYGYSCMGYEIAGGLGVKMAAPDREVFVLVGDGSYLMMAQELTTAAAEGIKLVVVLVQNATACAPPPAWTATPSPSTSPPTPPASAPTSSARPRPPTCGTRSSRRASPPGPRSSTLRRTPWRAPPTVRHGGTSRSRRCRRWTPPGRLAPDMRGIGVRAVIICDQLLRPTNRGETESSR
jgi:TPP-dependent trihydroxycyclohexane-1,2-dione (THcHDO) dehydratase